MNYRILSKFDPVPEGSAVIDTTSHSTSWGIGFSPFRLGPCALYGGMHAQVMENAWQYSKVYAAHADANADPTEEYWKWARAGWASPRANRYPMGKGAKPLYSLWDGERHNYIAARKRIFIPLYVRAVFGTNAWRSLRHLVCEQGRQIALRDFDGYDHVAIGRSLPEVLNDPKRTMGHAFVLAMMLEAYSRGASSPEEILAAIPFGEDPPTRPSLF